MATDKNTLLKLGRILWTIFLIAGFASLVFNWFTLHRVMPLDIVFIIVVIISLIAWFFNIPIVTTKGAKERLFFTIGLVVGTLGLIFVTIALRALR